MWVLAVVMVMVEEEGGKERRGSKLEAEGGVCNVYYTCCLTCSPVLY